MMIIVGQIVMDKLADQPLGNFQSQEEKQQCYTDYEGKKDANCLTSKLVIVLHQPTSQLWKTDYDTAVSCLDALQEDVAKNSAPRQYLLDKDHKPPYVRLTFPLWEKEVCITNFTIRTHYIPLQKYTKSRDKYLEDTLEEDDIMCSLCEDDDTKGILIISLLCMSNKVLQLK
jgi:hypothetical protein